MAATRGAHRVVPLCRVLLAGKEGRRALSSGRSGKDSSDADFEALFADMPPAHSAYSKGPPESAAAASTGESPLWKSLLGEPRSSTPANWSFLDELNKSHPKYSNPRTQASSSSSSSFRKMGGDSGFDFLKEELDRPATTQQEAGKQDLVNSSFKLLKDSFQKASMQPSPETVGKLDEVLGLDSSSLFSSSDTWSKDVDSRTLAEVEGKFYSTMDQTPVEDIKTYTYEELGEKLRQARPPAEQMLSSATGLSFGELRTRFQKIEQAEDEARENKAADNDFKELRESLSHLKPSDSPKSLAAKKQLSYEELAFVSHVGMRTGFRIKLEYTPPKDDLLTKYYSDVQLSSKERLKLEIKKLKEAFQIHDCDSGSPQVQIAILTARINNLNRHMREGPNYKRDKHSKKGLSDMVQYRRRLLRYLRRRDWPVYCNVLTKLKLDDVILEKRR